jgi:hypothetical protein
MTSPESSPSVSLRDRLRAEVENYCKTIEGDGGCEYGGQTSSEIIGRDDDLCS